MNIEIILNITRNIFEEKENKGKKNKSHECALGCDCVQNEPIPFKLTFKNNYRLSCCEMKLFLLTPN